MTIGLVYAMPGEIETLLTDAKPTILFFRGLYLRGYL